MAGVKGMKWGIRRYQNVDGTLTPEGERRYGRKGINSGRYKRDVLRDYYENDKGKSLSRMSNKKISDLYKSQSNYSDRLGATGATAAILGATGGWMLNRSGIEDLYKGRRAKGIGKLLLGAGASGLGGYTFNKLAKKAKWAGENGGHKLYEEVKRREQKLIDKAVKKDTIRRLKDEGYTSPAAYKRTQREYGELPEWMEPKELKRGKKRTDRYNI